MIMMRKNIKNKAGEYNVVYWNFYYIVIYIIFINHKLNIYVKYRKLGILNQKQNIIL